MVNKPRFILLAMLMLVVAACSSPSATPTTPISTPAIVSGSAASVDSSAVTMSQVAQLRNGNGDTLTALYPGNWIQGESTETMLLSNDEALLTSTTGIPESGQALISVLAFRDDFAQIITGQNDLTTARFLQAFIGNAGNDATRFSSIQPYLLDGREAARSVGQDDTSDAMLLVLQLDDGYALLIGATAKGELDTFEDTMQAILSSVTFDINPEPELSLESTATPGS